MGAEFDERFTSTQGVSSLFVFCFFCASDSGHCCLSRNMFLFFVFSVPTTIRLVDNPLNETNGWYRIKEKQITCYYWNIKSGLEFIEALHEEGNAANCYNGV